MPITVILLAAGYATRLYPLTKDRPKALLPFGSGVILDEVMRTVATVPDRRRSVLVTNHCFAEQFRSWQRERSALVTILDDGTQTPETRLGAIRNIELARTQADPSDDLLVIGTDNLFRWRLGDFVREAQRYRPAATVALWRAPSTDAATQFGVVVRDATSRLTAFVEKSPQPPSREVALCVYYFPAAMHTSITRFLNEGGNPDAPGYFIAWLVGQVPVYGVLESGAWYDIGSLASYETAQREWQESIK
jgi:glucose-1-phosphate thymidylyltransferase